MNLSKEHLIFVGEKVSPEQTLLRSGFLVFLNENDLFPCFENNIYSLSFGK